MEQPNDDPHALRKSINILGGVIAAMLALSILWTRLIASPGDLAAVVDPLHANVVRLETKVERLESTMQEYRESLARIETKLDALKEQINRQRPTSPRGSTN